MSQGTDKSLKITAALDTASFAKAKAAIDELTRAVEKLVKVTQQVNFGGGGGLGMKMSSSSPSAGGPSAASTMSTKMGGASGPSGGVANTLTQAVVVASNMFNAAAAGSKTAFKTMESSLKDMVRSSGREIRTLTSDLQDLADVYAKLGAGGGGGRGGGGGGGRLALPPMGGGGGGVTYIPPGGYTPGGGGGGGGPRLLGPMGGGPGGGGGVPGAAGGGGMGMLGGLLAGLAGGGAVYGAMKVANFGLSSVYENKAANLQYGVGLQSQTLNRQATYGNLYGGNATALYHGDIALSHAMQIAAKDKEYQRATASVNIEARKQIINLQNPTGVGGNLLKGGVLGGLSASGKSALGGFLTTGGRGETASVSALRASGALPRLRGATPYGRGNAVPGAAGGGLGEDFAGRTTLDIANAAEINKMPEQIAQQRQEALMAVMQRNPLLNAQMSEYAGGAMGDLNMARMARVGGGLVKNPITGKYTGDAVANFKARAIEAGWDPGQVAGMQQQIGAQVGWASRGVGSMGILSKQMGGFSSALSVAAMGAQFGAPGLVGGVAGRGGMVGRGGLDVSAGAQIFGAGAGMMASGGFAGSAMGLMETLGAAGFTGASGTDMRMARSMEAGIGAMGAMVSGNIDPLQRGLNASAAMKAAPGASYATHAALMSIDPSTMMAAIKSKSVPPELAKQGITLEILTKYMSAQNGTAFARYSESMGAGTEVGSAIARYQKSGGNMSYMKSWSLKRKQDELQTIGLGMKLAGGAPTMEAGIMRARLQAASEGVLTTPRGRGAFAVGAANVRKALLASESERTKKGGTALADLENQGGEFTKTIKNINPAMEASEKERQMSQKYAADQRGVGGAEGAIEMIDAAFKSFLAALRGDPQILGAKSGGIRKASAPGSR